MGPNDGVIVKRSRPQRPVLAFRNILTIQRRVFATQTLSKLRESDGRFYQGDVGRRLSFFNRKSGNFPDLSADMSTGYEQNFFGNMIVKVAC